MIPSILLTQMAFFVNSYYQDYYEKLYTYYKVEEMLKHFTQIARKKKLYCLLQTDCCVILCVGRRGTERSENSCISSLHYTTHLKKLIHPIYYRHGNNFENPQKKYSSHQWTGIIFQISRPRDQNCNFGTSKTPKKP